MSGTWESFWDAVERKALRERRKRWLASEHRKRMREEGEEDASFQRSRCIGEKDFPELPATLFMVGNVVLDIPREKSLRHPCAVIETENPLRVMISHGTHASNLTSRYLGAYVTVPPDAENGLQVRTAFSVLSKRISYRFLFLKDRIGRLSKEHFEDLTLKINRRGNRNVSVRLS